MNWEWLLIRGTGIGAFVLLAAATLWGLLLSTKVLGRLVKAKGLTYFHESLSVGALLLTVTHMFAVRHDDYIPFGWSEILLPGLSNWRPLAVAFGVLAFHGLVGVSASFYVKKRIGQKRWRTLHFSSLGVFLGALLHGVLAGTDTATPWVMAMYVGTTVGIVLLLAIRVTRIAEAATVPARSRSAA